MKFGSFELPAGWTVGEQHWEKKPVYTPDGKTHLYDEIKGTIRFVPPHAPNPSAEPKASDGTHPQ